MENAQICRQTFIFIYIDYGINFDKKSFGQQLFYYYNNVFQNKNSSAL